MLKSVVWYKTFELFYNNYYEICYRSLTRILTDKQGNVIDFLSSR